MDCNICYESFDHSIRKPYSLSSCPHTYCLKCLDQLNNNKCPNCNEPIKGKNINIALLCFFTGRKKRARKIEDQIYFFC